MLGMGDEREKNGTLAYPSEKNPYSAKSFLKDTIN